MSEGLLSLRASLPAFARVISIRVRLSRMLERLSLPDLLRSLTPDDAPRTGSPPLAVALDALERAERVLGAVPVIPNTCLYRALARYAVLRGAGYPARFFLAVDPGAPDIEGHAWVELNGEPCLESRSERLVVTYSYPAWTTPEASAA